MSRIHLSKAVATEVEEEFVLDALRSGWIAPLGPHVDAFENELASRIGVDHALALSSGTAALHLALLGVGAGPGTAVVVPSMTFSASAMPVMYAGAEPVFVDAREDGNVDPDMLFEAIDALRDEGTPVAAAMTVDLFGRCADYDAIVPGLQERGVPLIEDAAEALGATYHGRPAGSFGAMAVLSFNGNKILSTSGGGMLLSDDADAIARARYLSTQARQPVDYYQHVDVGYNYRLSNVLAALGRGQLSHFDEMLARRRGIWRMYVDALGEIPGVRFLGRPDDAIGEVEDNCWLTCIEVDPDICGVTPERLISVLAEQDIESRRLWKPMHLQPIFASRRSFVSGVSERLFDRGLALPSGSALRDDEIERVISVLLGALGER